MAEAGATLIFGWAGMQIPQPEPPPEEEPPDRVLEWRILYLTRAGYDSEAASLVAEERGIDLHMAGDLVLRGCPVDLALLILL